MAAASDSAGARRCPTPGRGPMRTGAGALPGVVVSALLAGCLSSACTFSPDIQSGKLTCSPKGECPRGFTCAPSGVYANRCVAEGTPLGTGGSPGGGFGGRSGGLPDGGVISDASVDVHLEAPPIDLGIPGTGGSGVPTATTAAFIGTWVFDAGSYVELDCGNGTTPMQYAIDRSTVSIYSSPSGLSYVGASWSIWSACTYQLYLGDDGGLHLFDANWQCSDTSDDPTYVWFGYDFDVFLTSVAGRTATHYGTYIIGSYYADGSNYYCNEYVSGTLTKL